MENEYSTQLHKFLLSLSALRIVSIVILLFVIGILVGWLLRSGEVDEVRGDLLMCTLLRVTGG